MMSNPCVKSSMVLLSLLIALILGAHGIQQDDVLLDEPQPRGHIIVPGGGDEQEPMHLQLGPAPTDQRQLEMTRVPLVRSWFPQITSMKTVGNQRRKKDCGFPVMTRRLFGPIMKRAQEHHFATSEEEVERKIQDEDNSSAVGRVKRNAISESHSGGCMAKRQWIDMGADFYPRYVKSYHCSSNTCDRGFGALGECKPKHYTTKVLKRITPADSTSVEDCDHTLPESLRFDWKLVSVQVTTCCDCVSPAVNLFGLK